MTRTAKIKAIQKILEVDQDGIIGPITRSAFEDLAQGSAQWHESVASSFADPEDVRKYDECINRGNSVEYCLKKGDNGVGYWGDDTTGATPAVALNKKHIINEWGTMARGKHKPVEVRIGNKTVTCILKDTGAPYNRVDLNPGACAAFGLDPPVLTPAEWRWA